MSNVKTPIVGSTYRIKGSKGKTLFRVTRVKSLYGIATIETLRNAAGRKLNPAPSRDVMLKSFSRYQLVKKGDGTLVGVTHVTKPASIITKTALPVTPAVLDNAVNNTVDQRTNA